MAQWIGTPIRTTTAIDQKALGGIVMSGMMMGASIPFVLSALAPFITRDLDLSRARFGTLITIAFAAATVGSVLAGRLIDGSSARMPLLVIFGLSASGLVVLFLAGSYAWMVPAAICSGLSMALSNPSTNKLIAAFGAERTRGLIVGIKQSGVQLGSFLSGLLLPFFAGIVGWRQALIGAVVVPVALATYAFIKIPSRWPHLDDPGERSKPRGIGGLMAYAFLMGGGIAASTAYLPLYANERLGLTEGRAGLLLAAVGFMGIFSRVAAGHFANRMRREARLMLSLAVAATVAQGLVWAAETQGLWLVWAGALLLGSSAVAWNSVAMLMLVKRLPFAVAGRASALVALAFYAGFIASPTAFGFIVDTTDSYAFGWALALGHFFLACVVALAMARSTTELSQANAAAPASSAEPSGAI